MIISFYLIKNEYLYDKKICLKAFLRQDQSRKKWYKSRILRNTGSGMNQLFKMGCSPCRPRKFKSFKIPPVLRIPHQSHSIQDHQQYADFVNQHPRCKMTIPANNSYQQKSDGEECKHRIL